MTALEFKRRDLSEAVRAAANGVQANGHADTSDWEPPVPFDDRDVPTFPVDALPRWLGAFVEAEAEALQVPVDLPALLGLAVIALVTEKKVNAAIKPGWTEPVNLYVMIALAPGEGKSPVFRDVTAPVHEHERAERDRLKSVIDAARAEESLAETRVKALRSRAANAKPEARADLEREHAEAAATLAGIRVPAEPRFIVDDATPEAIALRLHEQGGRLGVFSAEGGPLEIIAGRYSEVPNLDIILKAHSGDYCAVDRIGRASFVLPSPALTLALTVQPDVVHGLATKPGFRGRGLLGRFLFAMPRSRVGSRRADPPPVPPHVRAAYASAVAALLRVPEARDERGEIVSRAIELDGRALALLIATKSQIEPRLAPGGDLATITDWANKLAGTIARIAVLLHVADRARKLGANVWDAADETTMLRAIRIGEYLIRHALAAFAAMGADPAIEDARHVLAWLRRDGRKFVSRRDIQRAMPTRFRTSSQVDPAIQILEEHGYLRVQQVERSGAGRPPSPTYGVHPNL